jgi:hypothetical protein
VRFTLQLDLGNEAMQTAQDVADTLIDVAVELRETDPGRPLNPTDVVSVAIRDENGNEVGAWEVKS